MDRSVFDITGFQLKLAAIIAMTCNHVAHAFGAAMPEWVDFTLYSVGGMTFPIMAFLLVEGFFHTSSLRNYALRLFGFAIAAQIPYSFLWGAQGNVLFTLLIGLGLLWLCKNADGGIGLLAVVVSTVLFGGWLDWGSIGFVAIYLFYMLHDRGRKGILLTMALVLIVVVISAIMPLSLNDLGYALIGFPLATALLCGYKGERGRPLKWFFYAYYPVHLFAIWVLRVIML